ncbi:MAG: M48 family metallopeptidase [Bacteroidales bacterium]|nr:M48 family metallopeptidase [Bacteroidales bacterium]
MSSQVLFQAILAIVIVAYLIDLWLGYLNTTRWNDQLPHRLESIYDKERYKLQQLFERTQYKFNLISGFFSFSLLLGMLLIGGFAILDGWILSVTDSPVIQAVLFFGIIGLVSDILSIPFELYDTFRIEQKYGFNTTTLKTYWLDKLKSWLLAALIGGGLLALIVTIYVATGSWFWIIGWGVVTIFTIFVNYFYTSLIVPIFNKLSPLPDGELKTAIETYAKKVDFKIVSIYILDGSKRTKRGNAYFSGFGRKKKVVLYDTLLKEHSTEELVAILAHEIGHYKHHHVLKGLILGIIQTGLLFWVLSIFIGNPILAQALGATPGFHISLIAFGFLFSPVSTILGIFFNHFSRKHEYQADNFAASTLNNEFLSAALIRLSVSNLSNLTPHPWYVFIKYSHPTLMQRLTALEILSQKEK